KTDHPPITNNQQPTTNNHPMNTDVALFWIQESIKTGAMLAAPILGIALAVGLMVSLFQAITSIQEMTLSYIPKMVAVGIILRLCDAGCRRLLVCAPHIMFRLCFCSTSSIPSLNDLVWCSRTGGLRSNPLPRPILQSSICLAPTTQPVSICAALCGPSLTILN